MLMPERNLETNLLPFANEETEAGARPLAYWFVHLITAVAFLILFNTLHVYSIPGNPKPYDS
jgi:hypothetical protein